jgi:hypothetical protein
MRKRPLAAALTLLLCFLAPVARCAAKCSIASTGVSAAVVNALMYFIGRITHKHMWIDTTKTNTEAFVATNAKRSHDMRVAINPSITFQAGMKVCCALALAHVATALMVTPISAANIPDSVHVLQATMTNDMRARCTHATALARARDMQTTTLQALVKRKDIAKCSTHALALPDLVAPNVHALSTPAVARTWTNCVLTTTPCAVVRTNATTKCGRVLAPAPCASARTLMCKMACAHDKARRELDADKGAYEDKDYDNNEQQQIALFGSLGYRRNDGIHYGC